VSVPVVEPTITEDLPDLEIVHLVCCITEPDMRSFCGQSLDPAEEDETAEAISCAGCIEEEEKRGVGGCPRFTVCKQYKET